VPHRVVRDAVYPGIRTTWHQWHVAAAWGTMALLEDRTRLAGPSPDKVIMRADDRRAHAAAAHASHSAEARIRRRELAAFLRSRRERLSPSDVGLAPGGRRRTPGLRCEEVALLADVGVTWYTWLEQGRDINASEQVLDALARVLLLDPHERIHLFTLAGVVPPAAVGEEHVITTEVRAVLDRLHRSRPSCPTPAMTCSPTTGHTRSWSGILTNSTSTSVTRSG
jgi:transcriptional regulator with XRE-family HTH domain